MSSRSEFDPGSDIESPVAVILAADNGTRLRSEPSSLPKPMVRLRGLSLAERSIAQMLAVNVDRFVVVLGSDADRVRSEFERVARRRRCQIDFVVAEDWQKGNGCSAAAAQKLVGDKPFLLTRVGHLLPSQMIQTVLVEPPGAREIVLAVDFDTDNVFDVPDLTKVEVVDNRVASIGKTLESWNAGDTGLFYCTATLFDALSRAREQGGFSLSDGVLEIVAHDGVRAVDVTGERWLDVDTPEAFREATRRIDAAMAKGGEDGFVSQYLNRPISRHLSIALASTPLTPNHVTVISFLLALLGAAGLASTTPWLWIVGGIVIQIASIFDECDGELARIKLLQSRRGGWLDTMLDRYSDLAIGLAVTFAASQLHDAAWVWPAGFLATTSFLLASYVTKEYQIRFQCPYPNNLVNRLKRRDLRILIVAVGSVLGYPLVALLVIGALTHLAVIQILVSGWGDHHAPAKKLPLAHREPTRVGFPGDVVLGAKRDHAIVVSSAQGALATQINGPLENRSFRTGGE